MSILTPSGANVFGAPFVEILEYPIDREAAVSVSANLCRRHKLLPIGREGGTLIVAMADPNDILALDDVSAATRMRIRPVLVDAKDLATAIDRYHRADDELTDLSNTLQDQNEVTSVDEESEDDDAPIVRFVNLLISQAIQDRASDIHVEPGRAAPPRPLPHRRRAEGGAVGLDLDPERRALAAEDHGRARHLRASRSRRTAASR